MERIIDSQLLTDNDFSEAYKIDDIIIGKYRVAFGYRIRAGYIGNMWYELDLCCGAQEKDYKLLLDKVTRKMLSNPIGDRFKGIPTITRIKPYFNDDEFLEIIENW
ncbi:MAG: hypothetical protein ABIP51_20125 [Bacteroidia bacterium]